MFDSLRLKSSGFSVAELLPVIAIVVLLGAIVAPQIRRSPSAGWQQQVHQNYVASINNCVERYHAETGEWPAPDLSDIAGHPDYFPNGIPHNPLTGAPYAFNPDTYRVE